MQEPTAIHVTFQQGIGGCNSVSALHVAKVPGMTAMCEVLEQSGCRQHAFQGLGTCCEVKRCVIQIDPRSQCCAGLTSRRCPSGRMMRGPTPGAMGMPAASCVMSWALAWRSSWKVWCGAGICRACMSCQRVTFCSRACNRPYAQLTSRSAFSRERKPFRNLGLCPTVMPLDMQP